VSFTFLEPQIKNDTRKNLKRSWFLGFFRLLQMGKHGMGVDFLNLWPSQTLKAQDFRRNTSGAGKPKLSQGKMETNWKIWATFSHHTLQPPPKKKLDTSAGGSIQHPQSKTTKKVIEDFMPKHSSAAYFFWVEDGTHERLGV